MGILRVEKWEIERGEEIIERIISNKEKYATFEELFRDMGDFEEVIRYLFSDVKLVGTVIGKLISAGDGGKAKGMFRMGAGPVGRFRGFLPAWRKIIGR